MSEQTEDAALMAKAIAAKLSDVMTNSDLGKRKTREEETNGFPPAAIVFAPSTLAGLVTEEPLKKKKVYVPTAEHPEINFLGLLLGPRGSTQKQLQELSGAKILIRGKGSQKGGGSSGHPDDDEELHVTIEGTPEAVEKALKEVEAILFNPEEATRLKQEQLLNLAKMSNSSRGYGDMSSILATSSSGTYEMELRVPNACIGYVIGKGGEMLYRLQASTGTSMFVAKESEMKPGETLRTIIVKGSQEAVEECKRRVDEIVTSKLNPDPANAYVPPSKGAPRDLDTAFVMKIAVPNEKVGIVIGRQGTTVKGIQERTGCQILIPNEADANNPMIRTLSIGSNTKEGLEAAQMEITLALQQHEMIKQGGGGAGGSFGQSSVLGAYKVDPLYITIADGRVGAVIGRGGAKKKDIEARTQTRLQIPSAADPGSDPPIRTICISGTHDGQHAARYEIEMVLQNEAARLGGQSYGGYAGGAVGAGGGNMYGAQAWGAQAAPVASAYGQYGAAAYGQAPAGYGAQAAMPAAPTDHTAYYQEFWRYASYYGEAAARMYYTSWSPPVGTPPPPGIMLPQGAPAAGMAPAAAGNPYAAQQQPQAAAAVSTTAAGAGSNPSWDAYAKQYSQWYETHGRAMGADPNPPRQS